MSKFVTPDRKGEVMGNAVVAKPVPYKVISDIQRKTADGTMSELDAMCNVVAGFVTMDDGEPINTDELTVDAIAALFTFATEVKKEVADFTRTPSA